MTKNDTKNELLDCAQDLIQRVGVNAMSYNDLANQVGIRKASIHYHFPKKEDMIVALLTRCNLVYGQVYEEIMCLNRTPKEKLHLIADIFENGIRDGKVCIIGMLSVEFASLGAAVQQAAGNAINLTSKIYEKAFIQAVDEKTLPADFDTYAAAYGFFSFLLGVQILSRCRNDIDNFKNSVNIYIESILPDSK